MSSDKNHYFTKFMTKGNLNLCRLNLTDKDIPEIMKFLTEYPQLKTLDLSLNNIGDQGIADFAERNQTVTQVNFAGNNIGDGGIAIFAYRNQIVQHVNFSHNLISDQGITNFSVLNHTCFNTLFSKMQLH